jgi:RNA polymerase sigma-70 factor (ECF subfamily)
MHDGMIGLFMNETELILDAKKGDLEAFNRLVLAYQDMVYNQAYRMMGEYEAAQDATQTAFISVYKNLGSFRGGSFRAWMLRIVTNACYDELRRRRSHPAVPLEPVNRDGEEDEFLPTLADNSPHPEEHLERKELEAAIHQSLAEISPEYRDVLILVDMQGFSYVEAAQALGRPVGTVKSRLARGRMLLGGHLKRYWDLLPAQPDLAEAVLR